MPIPNPTTDPDLLTPLAFKLAFTLTRPLGAGTDGLVDAYTHSLTFETVAVKTPRPFRVGAPSALRHEARILALLNHRGGGAHENVARLLAFLPRFKGDACPALVSECAGMGDLVAWRKGLAAVSEKDVWGLFRDMVSALGWLHGECGVVHRDVKGGNILVTLAQGGSGGAAIPVFKLCDFSRAVEDPSRAEGEGGCEGKGLYGWAGTLAYAPPIQERAAGEPARPASDMWALGATLQEFALGVDPMQSRAALVAQLEKDGKPHPGLRDEEAWSRSEWRDMFGAAYRPLNVSALTLMSCFGMGGWVEPEYRPFSDELSGWYEKLFEVDHERRITAAALASEMVPLIDGYILGLVDETRRIDSARTSTQATDRRPSYEGNAYGPPSVEDPSRRRYL